ncbi:MAG: ABC transporter permease [Alphaproteobacteria bacterium]|nr:ABC transporter permease [Alphaproteobacteria bacterium]
MATEVSAAERANARPSAAPPAPRVKKPFPAYATRTISMIVVFIAWEIYGRQIDPIFFSYPSATALAAWKIILSGELVAASIDSLRSFLVGFAISLVGGVAIGLLMGRFRTVEHSIDLYVEAIYVTPRVALVPMIMLWFGLEFKAKVALVVTFAIFPILMNTYAGVRNISAKYGEVAQSFCCSEWQMMRMIVLPAALPFIMAGIRMGVGLGLVGMVIAEFFTTVGGLGGLILVYSNVFATDKLLVPLFELAILGFLLVRGVMYLETKLAPWKTTERLE